MKTDQVKQIKDIFVQAEPILKRKNKQKEIDAINVHLKNIENQETAILICGEFKRGKSSFINALIEQEICPVDDDIATAAVSIIKYGEKTKVTRQFGDLQNLQTETYDSLDEIERFVTGSNVENTVVLIIEIPSLKLKDGLVLIDTPGVGGLDPRHAFLTNYFLPKADIVLFITDKDAPISGAEISFFENKVIPFAKQKALIINKADLIGDSAETDMWIEDAKKKCSEGDSSLSVVAVSSKLKKKFIKDGKKKQKDYIESNFGEIELLINNLIDDHRKNLLIGLRDYIIAVFNEIKVPIKLQLDQIKEPNPELIKKLETEVQEYQAQKQALENPKSDYITTINELLEGVKKKVDSEINKEGVLIASTKLEALLNNSDIRNNPEKLEAEIQSLLGDLIFKVDQLMDNAFVNVMSEIGADANTTNVDSDFNGNICVTPVDSSVSEYAMNIGRASLPAIGIFSIASILTGGLLLPLTLAIGFFVKSIGDARKTKTIAEIRSKVQPQLHIAMQEIREYVLERFKNFNKSLMTALKERNSRLVENMSSALSDLNALKTEDAKQKKKKAALLSTELKPMEQVLTCAKVFMTNPFDKQQQVKSEEPQAPSDMSMDDKTIF